MASLHPERRIPVQPAYVDQTTTRIRKGGRNADLERELAKIRAESSLQNDVAQHGLTRAETIKEARLRVETALSAVDQARADAYDALLKVQRLEAAAEAAQVIFEEINRPVKTRKKRASRVEKQN
jgi:hypothetical protein